LPVATVALLIDYRPQRLLSHGMAAPSAARAA